MLTVSWHITYFTLYMRGNFSKTYSVIWVLVPLQVTTAVLSITAKAKARAKKSEASEEKMEVVRFSSSLLHYYTNVEYISL